MKLWSDSSISSNSNAFRIPQANVVNMYMHAYVYVYGLPVKIYM